MPSNLSPPLPAQREMCQAASAFLRHAAEAGKVEGIDPRPRVRESLHVLSWSNALSALAGLEHSLNPHRLSKGDLEKRSVGVQSPFGEAHTSALFDATNELYEGTRAVLDLWGMSQLWGSESYGVGGELAPGGSYAPGHAHFDVPKGGFPPIPRHVFDAMGYAVNQLAECIRAVEELMSERPEVRVAVLGPKESPAAKKPPATPPKRDGKADARDRWMYRLATKEGKTFRAIMVKLQQIAVAKRWVKLSSPTAVQQAINRHIKREGLDPLPPRKAT